MRGFIYIITNDVNQKIYIGQTRNTIEQRFSEHCRHSKFSSMIIHRAMRKYGIEHFSIKVLEECDIHDLDEREIFYIKQYDALNKTIGYNTSIGGDAPVWQHNNIDINDIIDLYCNRHETLQNIANRYNVSRYIITQMLRGHDIEIRNKHESNIKYNRINKNEAIEALAKYKSLRAAAKAIGEPYSALRNFCIANNIEYNSSKSTQQSQD